MKQLVCMILVLAMALSLAVAGAETPVTPISELDTENYTVDPKDPQNSQYFGLYSDVVTLESGATRTLYQYVPTTWWYRQPEVAVAVPLYLFLPVIFTVAVPTAVLLVYFRV